MSFGDDVNGFGKKTVDSINRTVRAVELRLFRAVILDSPVDTGRFRGNWQSTLGAPAAGTVDVEDPGGASTISEVKAFIDALRGGRVTFLSNNLPYAVPLEYGYSRQAPAGMVRKNVARFDGLVQSEARKNRV